VLKLHNFSWEVIMGGALLILYDPQDIRFYSGIDIILGRHLFVTGVTVLKTGAQLLLFRTMKCRAFRNWALSFVAILWYENYNQQNFAPLIIILCNQMRFLFLCTKCKGRPFFAGFMPPYFNATLENTNLTPRSKSINCSAHGYPIPIYEWKHNNKVSANYVFL